MDQKIRVIQYGMGPIGAKMVEYMAGRPAFELVGAVDIDPAKIGTDAGELAGLKAPLGLTIRGDGSRVLARTQADVVVLTTTSSLERITPLVLEIVSSGKNVVSSCEELVYPWLTQPDVARRIDAAAKLHQVSVLATGVNPGFLMDFLPLVLSGLCRDIRKLTVERVQDAQFRRHSFQTKIGAGLDLEAFNARAKAGVLRHVGLIESIHLIASGLGWELERAEESLTPVVAERAIDTADRSVRPGQVAGVKQVGRGYVGGEEVITLVFQAAVCEPEPRERILIEGTPDIDLAIKGGVNGDIATCAILANAIPVLVEASPGLRSLTDLTTVTCRV